MASNKKNDYYQGVGRRKTSVATTRLYRFGKKEAVTLKKLTLKKGDFYVNNKLVDDYFKRKGLQEVISEPMKVTDTKDTFAVVSFVKGGGLTGQIEALRLALSKSLITMTQEFKPKLKKEGYVTRDARVKERRKVGTGGKARRKKQSPKR